MNLVGLYNKIELREIEKLINKNLYEISHTKTKRWNSGEPVFSIKLTIKNNPESENIIKFFEGKDIKKLKISKEITYLKDSKSTIYTLVNPILSKEREQEKVYINDYIYDWNKEKEFIIMNFIAKDVTQMEGDYESS